MVWSELGSHAALRALASDELTALLRRHIAAALEPFGDTVNIAVERIRLERLLTAWMDLERRRAPFTIATLEELKTVEIGGLRLEVRSDRVDQLDDGRQVILDYKTGEIKSRGWEGDRLEEPQLPLYCVASEAPLAGAAFARIRTGDLGFTGIADTALPEFQSYTGKNGPPLPRQVEQWRKALAETAREFRAGEARVDPKHGSKTCAYCAIVPLCRIREYCDE